ncbi:GHKL domain-containing protein [Thermodesulfobacterium sp. TA1]|uniref:two-component system sensor histidine kinase NtrB n=1 Tax=Thermodesulfobacterium sp. TA1 TaxID=2234087 RepID=UPI0012320D4F|nr:ATP-binding protein [Thermodesulfobacterium sp. TA1]QER42740.1 GHKL domain-containing protein [Thermodesulfobacterium sp. TA1]
MGKNDKLRRYLKTSVLSWVFLGVSLIAGFLFFIAGVYNYKNIEKTLENALKLQAIGVEITLKSLIKNFNLDLIKKERNFFVELLLGNEWEGVAYVAIYDKNGTALLHSNPELIGQKIEQFVPIRPPFPRSFYQTSLTEEKLFLYENLIRLKNEQAVLRVALHVYPVEERLSYARRHIYLEFLLGLVFIGIGGIGFWFFRKTERLIRQVEDLERWRFISQVLAHEMKNPLASIKGFTQLILKKNPEEKTQKALNFIFKETLRMENLLRTLNSYTHPLLINPSNFNLKELLTEVVETFKLLYPEADLRLNLRGENFLVFTDQDKLKEILINLLENAWQASQENGSLRVDLGLNSEKNFYIIYIKDYGKGIPKELLLKVWEPFFTTKAKGMGLGLTIVKKLCEELNLSIELKSQPAYGTEVWLKIPR